MADTPKPSPADIEKLEDEAEALEDRAEKDGLIPVEDDILEGGVGPQSGVVP